jgi:hypothetical protein
VSESKKPDIIAITEVLPKNMRYTVNKAELDIEGFQKVITGFFSYVSRTPVYIWKIVISYNNHMRKF